MYNSILWNVTVFVLTSLEAKANQDSKYKEFITDMRNLAGVTNDGDDCSIDNNFSFCQGKVGFTFPMDEIWNIPTDLPVKTFQLEANAPCFFWKIDENDKPDEYEVDAKTCDSDTRPGVCQCTVQAADPK